MVSHFLLLLLRTFRILSSIIVLLILDSLVIDSYDAIIGLGLIELLLNLIIFL